MAEQKNRDQNLPPRDFIEALVEDPANPPQLQVLTGYRGRSAQEGQTRLYLDPTLSGWVDIPGEAILFQREVQDEYGLGKSLVWTRPDAQLQIGPQASGDTGADFLQGQVAQDLGGGGAQGPIPLPRTQVLCPTLPPFLCAPPPSIGIACVPSVQLSCQFTQNPRQCVLQTVDPQQCPPPPPTPGIACIPSVLLSCQFTQNPRQCVLQTVDPQQCPPPPPTPGIACIPSILLSCQFTQNPQQCVLQTANPQQCPSLGITCTALAPCPTRDPQQCVLQTANPEQCPSLGFTCTALPPQCPQRTTSPLQCPSLGFTCTSLPPCPTRDVAQCLPQPTSNPQLCPVATPVPGCGPGFPGDPGGPVEGGPIFGGQGFQAQGMGAEAVTQICPVPQTQLCPVPQTSFCPVPQTQFCPVPRTQICPVPHTPFCPVVQTIQIQCRRTIFEPHCFQQVTPPWQIPGTTPQFGTPQLGGFAQGAQGFQGVEAVGGAGQAFPQTQFCPAPSNICPVTFNCPQTQNLQCPITQNPRFCPVLPPTVQHCPTINPVCPPLTHLCGGGF
jgi:hypothetical protein